MRTEYKNCHECGGPTEQEMLGFIPVQVLHGDSLPEWVQAAICTQCGSLNILSPSERQLDMAEERYMRKLVEYGIITEQDAQDILN